MLRKRKAPQADRFPKDHRPWDWFESLISGERFQVKLPIILIEVQIGSYLGEDDIISYEDVHSRI